MKKECISYHPIFKLGNNNWHYCYSFYDVLMVNGVDYIFDINKKEDLLSVVDGGMTAQEISQLWSYYNNGKITQYFMYGANHLRRDTYEDLMAFKECLAACAEEVLEYVIKYPWVDEYKVLYQEYVTDILNKEGK